MKKVISLLCVFTVIVFLLTACKKKKIPVPAAPSSLIATTVSSSQINLSWTDVSTNETGYKIERKTGSSSFAEIASLGANATSFSDVGLNANTTYTYRILAYNQGGNSATYSNEASATTFNTIPTAASNLTAIAISHNRINLSWADNSNNEAGFKVERKTVSGTFSEVATLAANTTTYSDNGLTPSTQYIYRVYPYNNGGNASYSNEATATTTPDITTGLVAFYPFSGNAGDSSGNANHGTVNGAVLTADRFASANKAYSFSGAGCATYIGATINTTSITTALTISFWANRSGNGCQNPRLLSFWPGTLGPGTLDWGWDNSSTTNLIFNTSTNSQYTINGSFNVVANGVWTHLVYTNDGTSAKVYQDGVLRKNITVSGNPVLSGNASFGRLGLPLNDAFNGNLDDIRIYNRTLNQTEISYLSTH